MPTTLNSTVEHIDYFRMIFHHKMLLVRNFNDTKVRIQVEQWVECLPGTPNNQDLVPSIIQIGLGHTCYLST